MGNRSGLGQAQTRLSRSPDGGDFKSPPPRGGVTPIYGLYRYVPRDRVWFFNKYGVIFAPFGIVFPVLSSDRVPKFYQLK